MAGGSLGSLVVEISANVAKWSADMTQVAQVAERTAARVDDAFTAAGKALVGLASAASLIEVFDLMKEKIEGAIEAAAGLEQISQRTGATVAGLADLALVAKLSGTGTDELAGGLQKLAKAMLAAENGNAKAVAAFSAIGLSIQQLQGLKPDEVFKIIAERLNTYADGASKVAVAQTLFGKAGADLLPVIKDLAEHGDLHSKITEDEAKKAEQLEKDIRLLKATMSETSDEMFRKLIPALSATAQGMLAAQKAGAGFLQTLISIPLGNLFAGITNTPIQERLDSARAAVKNLQDQIANPSIKTPEFLTGLQRQLTAAKASLEALLAQQRAVALAGDTEGVTDQVTRGQTAPVKPDIKFEFDPAKFKAIRDAAIKDLDRSIAEEDSILKQREQFLQRYYNEDQLSLEEYYAKRAAAIQDNAATVAADYAKEISAAQAFAAKVKGTNEEVAASEKVRELQDKQQKAATASGLALIQNQLDEADAARKQREAIEQLNIALLKMQGRLEEAAEAQARLSTEQLPQRHLGAGGDAAAAAEIAAKRNADLLAARQTEISAIEARESIVEQRIALEQSSGQTTQLGGLAKLRDAREQEIAQLEVLVQKYDALAQASDSQADIDKAAQLHLKLDQLKADADPLAQHFQDLFQTAFADNLDKAVQGTESLSKAFKNMIASIQSDLSKMASQDIAKALFGGGGAGGGQSGGIFASLFSSLGGIGGGTGLAAGQAGPPANAAPGVSGGLFASLFSSMGSLFGPQGASAAAAAGVFQEGTDYVPRTGLGLLHEGEAVLTASENRDRQAGAPRMATQHVQNVHIHLGDNSNVTRESANHLAATVARHLSRVSARNN
jgi:ribosomal protein S17E